MKKFKVGFVHKGYPEQRNILFIKGIKFLKVFDWYKLIDLFLFKVLKKQSRYYHNSFNDIISYPKVNLYHFFNSVNYGNRPWVSTFETLIPRYPNDRTKEKKGIKALCANSCKKIIPFSNFNKELQLQFVQKNYPESYNIIASKMEVIYPPQNLNLQTDFTRFDSPEKLKFLFVGHDFFRKGGREVLNALNNLKAMGYDFELIIVSKLQPDNFITKTTQFDSSEYKKTINSLSYCTHYNSLPNKEIYALMNKAHVMLFPSLQETFGYVVLEAQSTGLPVVTTSIRAFPEINNSECGWIIDIPQTDKGFADVFLNKYDVISNLISQGMLGILKNILDNPEQLLFKAKNSYQRIQNLHNPEKISLKLIGLYEQALKD